MENLDNLPKQNPGQNPAAGFELKNIKHDPNQFISLDGKLYRLLLKRPGQEPIRLDPTIYNAVYHQTADLLQKTQAKVTTLDKLVITSMGIKEPNIKFSAELKGEFDQISTQANQIFSEQTTAEKPLEKGKVKVLEAVQTKPKVLWQAFKDLTGMRLREEVDELLAKIPVIPEDRKNLKSAIFKNKPIEEAFHAFLENTSDFKRRFALLKLLSESTNPKVSFEAACALIQSGIFDKDKELDLMQEINTLAPFFDMRIKNKNTALMMYQSLSQLNKNQQQMFINALHLFVDTRKKYETSALDYDLGKSENEELTKKFFINELSKIQNPSFQNFWINASNEVQQLDLHEIRNKIKPNYTAGESPTLEEINKAAKLVHEQKISDTLKEFSTQFPVIKEVFTVDVVKKYTPQQTAALEIFMNAALEAKTKNNVNFDVKADHNVLLFSAYHNFLQCFPSSEFGGEDRKNSYFVLEAATRPFLISAERLFQEDANYQNPTELFEDIQQLRGETFPLSKGEKDFIFQFLNNKQALNDFLLTMKAFRNSREKALSDIQKGETVSCDVSEVGLINKYGAFFAIGNPKSKFSFPFFSSLSKVCGNIKDTTSIAKPFLLSIYTEQKGDGGVNEQIQKMKEIQNNKRNFNSDEQDLIAEGYIPEKEQSYWNKIKWNWKKEDVTEVPDKKGRIFRKGNIVRGYAIPGKEELHFEIPIDISSLSKSFEESEAAMKFIQYFLDNDTLEDALNFLNVNDDAITNAKNVFGSRYTELVKIATDIYTDYTQKSSKAFLMLGHPEVQFDGVTRVDRNIISNLENSLKVLLGTNFVITDEIRRVLTIISLNNESKAAFQELLTVATTLRQANLSRLNASLGLLPFTDHRALQITMLEAKLTPVFDEELQEVEEERVAFIRETGNYLFKRISESAGIMNFQVLTDPFSLAVRVPKSTGPEQRYLGQVKVAKSRIEDPSTPPEVRELYQRGFTPRGVANVYERFEVHDERGNAIRLPIDYLQQRLTKGSFRIAFAIPGKEIREVTIEFDLTSLKPDWTAKECAEVFQIFETALSKGTYEDANKFILSIETPLFNSFNKDTLKHAFETLWGQANNKIGKALMTLGHPELKEVEGISVFTDHNYKSQVGPLHPRAALGKAYPLYEKLETILGSQWKEFEDILPTIANDQELMNLFNDYFDKAIKLRKKLQKELKKTHIDAKVFSQENEKVKEFFDVATEIAVKLGEISTDLDPNKFIALSSLVYVLPERIGLSNNIQNVSDLIDVRSSEAERYFLLNKRWQENVDKLESEYPKDLPGDVKNDLAYISEKGESAKTLVRKGYIYRGKGLFQKTQWKDDRLKAGNIPVKEAILEFGYALPGEQERLATVVFKLPFDVDIKKSKASFECITEFIKDISNPIKAQPFERKLEIWKENENSKRGQYGFDEKEYKQLIEAAEKIYEDILTKQAKILLSLGHPEVDFDGIETTNLP